MTAHSGENLDRLGVTHIICVLENPISYTSTFQDIKILHIPLEDNASSDIFSYFEDAVEFITEALGTTSVAGINKEEIADLKDVAHVLTDDTTSPDQELASSAIERPNVVLVHCLAGMSRSATIVCAYLLATTPMNTEETIAFVKSKRSIIHPNYGFQKQLKAWEAKYFAATHKHRNSSRDIAASLQERIRKYQDAVAGRQE